MTGRVPEVTDAFEEWLLRREAHAVEAGEVCAELLTELHAEFDAARERPQEESHAMALEDIAERLGNPRKRAENLPAALEGQPMVTRGLLLRRFAEAWLKGQREAYHRARGRG